MNAGKELERRTSMTLLLQVVPGPATLASPGIC